MGEICGKHLLTIVGLFSHLYIIRFSMKLERKRMKTIINPDRQTANLLIKNVIVLGLYLKNLTYPNYPASSESGSPVDECGLDETASPCFYETNDPDSYHTISRITSSNLEKI